MSVVQWSAVFAGISALCAVIALFGLWFARQQVIQAREQVVQARQQAIEARRVADIEEERIRRERVPLFAAWLSAELNENLEYVRLNIQIVATPKPITWIRVEIARGLFRIAVPPVTHDDSWLGLDCWRNESVEYRKPLDVGDRISWGLTLPLTDEQLAYRDWHDLSEPEPLSIVIKCKSADESWPGIFPSIDTSTVNAKTLGRIVEAYVLLKSDDGQPGISGISNLEAAYRNPDSPVGEWIKKILDRTGVMMM